VEKAQRGFGLQTVLIEMMEAASKKAGGCFALTSVSPYNRVSRNNLERAGFVHLTDAYLYGGLERQILIKELL